MLGAMVAMSQPGALSWIVYSYFLRNSGGGAINLKAVRISVLLDAFVVRVCVVVVGGAVVRLAAEEQDQQRHSAEAA